MNAYIIRLEPDGTADVLRNRRAWRYDLADLEEALAHVRRAEGKGRQVTVWEPDGRRRKIRT